MSLQKFSGDDTPGLSQREAATPSRTKHPTRPLAGRGARAPRCWNSNLGPPQLFSRGCDVDYDAQHKDQVGHTIRSVTVLQRFYCWYLILLRCDLDLWPCYLDLWPWTFVMYRLWRDETLYQMWAKSSNQRCSYYYFNVWPNDLWTSNT